MFQLSKSAPAVFFCIWTCFIYAQPVSAFWVWTPQKGKFENPSNAAKKTAAEQMIWAQNFYEAGEYEDALKAFEKIPKHFPQSEEAVEASFFAALCREELGKYYEAFQSYQDVLDLYPRTPRVNEIVERQFRIGHLFSKEEKKKVAGVTIPLVPTTARARALEVYQQVIDNVPFGPHAAPARYHIGLTHFEDEKYTQALAAFEHVYEDFPSSEHAEEARFKAVLCVYILSQQVDYDSNRIHATLERLEDFVGRYPDSEHVDRARQMMAELNESMAEEQFNIAAFYEKQKYNTSAKLYYRDLVDNFPDTEWAGMAQRKLDEMLKHSGEEAAP